MNALDRPLEGRIVKRTRFGLCLLGLLLCSGCATILFPERALVPQSRRGDVDVVMVAADALLSIPTLLVGIMGHALGGVGFSKGEEKALLFPLWVDCEQGTLWHPKPDDRPARND